MSWEEKIIYSINVEDVQNVAEEEIGRTLSRGEIDKVERKIGDYVDWYGAIDEAIKKSRIH
jgi:hypothetical protein